MPFTSEEPDRDVARAQFGLKSLFLLTTAVGVYCLTINRMPIGWHVAFIGSIVGMLHAIPCVEYGYLRGLVLYRIYGWLLFCVSFIIFAMAIGSLALAVAMWCYGRLWFP